MSTEMELLMLSRMVGRLMTTSSILLPPRRRKKASRPSPPSRTNSPHLMVIRLLARNWLRTGNETMTTWQIMTVSTCWLMKFSRSTYLGHHVRLIKCSTRSCWHTWSFSVSAWTISAGRSWLRVRTATLTMTQSLLKLHAPRNSPQWIMLNMLLKFVMNSWPYTWNKIEMFMKSRSRIRLIWQSTCATGCLRTSSPAPSSPWSHEHDDRAQPVLSVRCAVCINDPSWSLAQIEDDIYF